ncbi:hypothetical protein K0U07_04510, partial [bacterium]|nr:hypothetical protein [bacterium]
KKEKQKAPSPLPIKSKTPTAPLEKKEVPIKAVEKTLELPTKKPEAPPKKDAFYSEWEKKYKELHAESLLSKEPAGNHALFIVDAEKEFAGKIASAIHTKLMKTTFVLSTKPLSEMVEKYKPTHIITARVETETLDLPTITIDNLGEIKKDVTKKKSLWSTLQQKLGK